MEITDAAYDLLLKSYSFLRKRIDELNEKISALKKNIEELEEMLQAAHRTPEELEGVIEFARKKADVLRTDGISEKFIENLLAPMQSGTAYSNVQSALAAVASAVSRKLTDCNAEKTASERELENTQYECDMKNAEINSYVPSGGFR